MDIDIVGLGRMGANMARRLARKSVRVAAQDVSPVARSAVEHEPGERNPASRPRSRAWR